MSFCSPRGEFCTAIRNSHPTEIAVSAVLISSCWAQVADMWVSAFPNLATASALCKPAARTSPRSLLERQHLRLYPRYADSDLPFNKTPQVTHITGRYEQHFTCYLTLFTHGHKAGFGFASHHLLTLHSLWFSICSFKFWT